MNPEPYYLALTGASLVLAAGLLAALLAVVLALGLLVGRRAGRLEAERGLAERILAEREDAVKRSRAVLGGLAAEQAAPYLPGFPADPGDLRFIGKPVDFVAFAGASGGEVREVLFVEVKSGTASPSRVERSLRDAVRAGRVRWAEYRVPDPGPSAPSGPAPATTPAARDGQPGPARN
jgi:predicted Holliday junction resolvase-like endonuclease